MIFSRISYSFIILIELICLVRGIDSFESHETCLEFTNPLNRFESNRVHCPIITSSSSSILDKRASNDNMFNVNFTCTISNQTLCSKVKDVFYMAGQYISNTLNLQNTINVDAQFVDFCQEQGDCNTENVILGAASPARMIPYQDSDGKKRLYPQALLKQMNTNSHPAFGPTDITAIFNSRMNYWFQGDPTPMPPNYVDMSYVVLHEMIHGLGFTNSWNDYTNIQALTPNLITTTGSSTSSEFVEYAFDRYMVLLQSGTPLTSITDELNQFKSSSANPNDFFSAFKSSPQFSIAQDMYKNAVTHGTMGLVLTSPGTTPSNSSLTKDQINNDILVLETSLNPFEPGSSIGHVDFNTYLQSSDFLMMFTYPPGETLNDMMDKAGSTNTGPIGPKLKRFLGVLGYNTNKAYTPPAGSSDASFISFNLSLFLVCILLTFINNLL